MRLACLFASILVLSLVPTSTGCSAVPEQNRSPETDDMPERDDTGDDPEQPGRRTPDEEKEPGEPRPEATRIGSAVVVDLGDVSAGKTATLEVPANALGFNLVVEGGSVGIQKITSPKSLVVHDAFMPKNGTFPTSEAIDGAASVSVPQNDVSGVVPVTPGPWTITFGGSGSARAKAWIQTTSDGRFHGGTLDIVVHVPTGLRMASPSAPHTVDPAKASTDRDILARIDRFYGALKTAYGIDRGKVSFATAPAALRILSTEEAITAAASIAKGTADAQALHIVLANAIGEGEGELLGLSPGIPGAAIRQGTSMSAVMVAHYDDTDVETEALTWLHEMGHFVGLQHTTEFDGSHFDPLSDTPKCTGGTQNAARCPDNGNIMFTGAFPSVPKISNAQKAVFRGSPIYRAYPDDAAQAKAAASAPAAEATASLPSLEVTARSPRAIVCRSRHSSPTR